MSRQQFEPAGLEVALNRNGGLEPAEQYASSGLEAVGYDQSSAPEATLLYVPAGLEKVRTSGGLAPEVAGQWPTKSGELSPGYQDAEHNVLLASRPRRRWLHKRSWILAELITLLLVIAAIVLGIVFGTRGHSGSGTTNNTSIGNTTSANATSTGPTGPPTAILANTGLASVAYPDNTTNEIQYRVYYQDEAMMIRESAWNSTVQVFYCT